MQHLLPELLWNNPEIHEAADRLRKSLPGFEEAKQAYEALAKEIQDKAGFELYDRYFEQFMAYSDYEVLAYYTLGLGLKEELVQELEPYSPK